MNRDFRGVLLRTTMCLSVVAGLSAIAPAYAQDSGDRVGELVVTAQRREQNLVDVPLAVGVVSGEALANANYSSLVDLQYIAPTVTYNTNFGGGFEIRGIGTQSVTASIEQSVSIVIDDVVYGLPEISFSGPSYQALTDIQRIEVLRGPQGTLFGKNSSAGVIQVITERPELGEFGWDGSVSYATDNEIKGSTNVNIPLSDTVAARLSAFHYSRDGYIHNRYTGEDLGAYDNWGVRGKLLYQPNDQLELYLIGSFTRNADNGNGIWTLRTCGSGFRGGLGVFSACAASAPYGVVPGADNLDGAWDGAIGVRSKSTNFSGRLAYDFGWATLRIISAYMHGEIDEDVEVDSSPRRVLTVNHNNFDDEQVTHEFRLEGGGDNLDWVGGFFYYNADVLYPGYQAGTYNYLPDSSPILLTSGVGGPVPCCISVMHSQTTSLAAYAQATWRPIERIALTGGLRYTDDKNSLQNYALDLPGLCQFAFALGGACKPAAGLPSRVLSRAIEADNLSGRATVQYYFTPDVNVFLTYSTGYKGPSISYPRGLQLVPVGPETVENYEAGLKGAFFDGSFILSATVFSTEYADFQGTALYLDPSNPGNRSYVTTNAGGLKVEGGEIEATWRVTDDLTLSAGYAYTPTEFTSFAIPCSDRFSNPATVPGQCNFANPSFPGTLQFNAAGYPLPYAPDSSYTLNLNYEHPVFGDKVFQLAMNYRWQEEYWTVVADPNTVVPSRGILGATLALGAEDDRWKLSVFARNLLDEYFVSGIFKTPLDQGTAGSTPLSTIGYSNFLSMESQRTVGVRLDFDF